MNRSGRILLLMILVVVAVLLAGGTWVWWALHRVPDFYSKTVFVPPETLRPASNQMLRNTAALTSDLQRKSGQWQAVFTAEQINGWLAVDVPQNHPKSIPPSMSDPRVAIEPGKLTIAARYAGDIGESVISLETDIFLPKDRPDTIAIRIRALRAGAVPIGIKKIVDGLTHSATESEWDLRWRQLDGDPVAYLSPTPREGQRQVWHIDTLELRANEIFIAGHTGEKSGSQEEPHTK